MGVFEMVIGIVLIIVGAPGLLDSFARFALQGLGTPAPLAPTRYLVVTVSIVSCETQCTSQLLRLFWVKRRCSVIGAYSVMARCAGSLSIYSS